MCCCGTGIVKVDLFKETLDYRTIELAWLLAGGAHLISSAYRISCGGWP